MKPSTMTETEIHGDMDVIHRDGHRDWDFYLDTKRERDMDDRDYGEISENQTMDIDEDGEESGLAEEKSCIFFFCEVDETLG